MTNELNQEKIIKNTTDLSLTQTKCLWLRKRCKTQTWS